MSLAPNLRTLSRLGLLCAVLAVTCGKSHEVNVKVSEATNHAATVSPDHKTIVMDVQGVLWSLPFSGGPAKRLTDDFLEPARPDYAPSGGSVAFEAFKGGTFHIWTMNPDGSNLKQLTSGHGDDRDPRWSPDGSRIAFSSDRAFAGSYDIWVVDVASGALTQWTSATSEEFEPTWAPDGSSIAFVSGATSAGVKIESVAAAGGLHTTLLNAPKGTRLNSPAFSPDGTRIAYLQFASNKSNLMVSTLASGIAVQVGASNDVFPFYPAWLSNTQLLYTADGKIRTTTLDTAATAEIPFETQFTVGRPDYARRRYDFDSTAAQQARGIVSPALSPDANHVVFEALNQLYILDIGTPKPRQITSDGYLKVDPTWSRDGTKIIYSSDRAGTEDVYSQDVTTGVRTRVTSGAGAEVAAALSPDGTQLAYQDQTAATFVVPVSGGSAPRQLVAALFAPGRPSWSADGKTISFAALKPYTHRFREGTSQLLTVDVASGAVTYTEPSPFKSLNTRGDDGPVYSPDGTQIVFGMDGVLYTRAVGPNGVATGDPKQITSEPSDAPSWSGDSKQILYLSKGFLRLINADGSNARTLSLDLSWQAEKPTGRTVINAGRLWDGKGAAVQTNVDVIVKGNRIDSIVPHNASNLNSGDVAVDASALTVLPGLVESHTHEFISGKYYGDRLGRLWLSYGVTSLRSVGDPIYRAVETREAFGSGARVGPRFFATGEAVDGERVYYNFMRPVLTDQQLQLELQRGQAVDYEMVKTYVRLPHDMQAVAAQSAHAMGVWAASHYMLPGMSHGMDGQTHVSATTRLGFAYTRSSAGVSYKDMIDLFSQSGMFDISTTFNPSLYAEDPTMVDDQRLQVLNTPWDEVALRAKRDAAVNTDQSVSLDSLQKEEATVAGIIAKGGAVLAGTDSPLDNVATALHLNLRAQQKYGRKPWEALQTATILPARMFGLDRDLGTVEPGKLADLVMVSGDPTVDVKDTANVRSVMKNGKMYQLSDLMAPFATPAGPVAPPAAAPFFEHPSSAALWWHDAKQMVDDEQ